ncbi:uncharacterized protein V6R79_000537 [Siganus canaliculatus]
MTLSGPASVPLCPEETSRLVLEVLETSRLILEVLEASWDSSWKPPGTRPGSPGSLLGLVLEVLEASWESGGFLAAEATWPPPEARNLSENTEPE